MTEDPIVFQDIKQHLVACLNRVEETGRLVPFSVVRVVCKYMHVRLQTSFYVVATVLQAGIPCPVPKIITFISSEQYANELLDELS